MKRTILSLVVLLVCNLAMAAEKPADSAQWAEIKANLDGIDVKQLQFDLETQKRNAELLTPKGPWLSIYKLGHDASAKARLSAAGELDRLDYRYARGPLAALTNALGVAVGDALAAAIHDPDSSVRKAAYTALYKKDPTRAFWAAYGNPIK